MKMAMTKFMYMMIFCLSTSIEATEMWRSMLDSIDSIMDITEMSDTQDCSSVRFYVSSRSNNYKTVQVWTGDWRSLSFAGLDRDERIVVLVHGFSNNHSSPAMETLKEGIRGRSISYIGVDWSDIAITVNYPFVASKVRAIGYCLADFLYFLISETAIRLNNLHLVGHSLGAHVSGFAGKRFQEEYDLKLYRITCLDPAGPLFNYNKPTARLDRTDADVVDCILSTRYLYGHIKLIGTANFIVNGGTVVQPPCKWEDFRTAYFCSHVSVVKYFNSSCDDWNIFEAESCYDRNGVERNCNGARMGFPASRYPTFHEMHLEVNEDYPYAKEEW
uniref:Lipase member H n=2 Tax=Lygus hesperus TaxID=30085 RepID=A0A0A9XC10_LYGHE